MGLVLEWVFGSIVSTAEKARDGAKRQLGLRPPSAQQAHKNLVQCLEQQAELEARAKASKDLLNAMLNSRKEADELGKQYDMKVPADPAAAACGTGDAAEGGANGAAAAANDASAMPDAVIVKILAREVLLTTAKLCALDFENMSNTRNLHNLKSQIRHVGSIKRSRQAACRAGTCICNDVITSRLWLMWLPMFDGMALLGEKPTSDIVCMCWFLCAGPPR
jgi:hypothetical protein